MLDVSSRLVVIVGGGAVAARKARGLLEAGATRVRCVAPEFRGEIPAAVERVAEPYRSAHLDGAQLVFAATDRPDVNEAVVRDAQSRGILVCRADGDDRQPGDFSSPAALRRGEVVVSVSADSPALAALIRDGIAQRFDERWSEMASAMRELRPLIKRALADGNLRRTVFHKLATEEALGVVHAGGVGALREWLRQAHPELDS
jgi:precorrin-2 dehydrogenase/sirohydrochlorin ferrochelatase